MGATNVLTAGLVARIEPPFFPCPIVTENCGTTDVHLVPEADICSAAMTNLFDYLVGAHEP